MCGSCDAILHVFVDALWRAILAVSTREAEWCTAVSRMGRGREQRPAGRSHRALRDGRDRSFVFAVPCEGYSRCVLCVAKDVS